MNQRQTPRDAPHDAQNWIAVIVIIVGLIALGLGKCATANAQDRSEIVDIVDEVESVRRLLDGIAQDFGKVLTRQDQILAQQKDMAEEIELVKRKNAELEGFLKNQNVAPAVIQSKKARSTM